MQSTPPGAIVRNLTFQSENLGRDTTILLVFDTDMEGLYDTIYPVVWKTFTFPKTDWYSYNVTYSDDLGFSKVRIGNRNLLDTLGHFKLKPGQKTTLSLNDDDDLRFSLPVNGTNDYLTAENETGFHQDLAVGFYDPSRTFTYGPAPMLFFKEVGNGSKATAQCKPVLRIYVESDYRETEVLVDAIKSTAILEQDLHQLFRNTVFNLERNMLTGRYKLTKTKPGSDYTRVQCANQ